MHACNFEIPPRSRIPEGAKWSQERFPTSLVCAASPCPKCARARRLQRGPGLPSVPEPPLTPPLNRARPSPHRLTAVGPLPIALADPSATRLIAHRWRLPTPRRSRRPWRLCSASTAPAGRPRRRTTRPSRPLFPWPEEGRLRAVEWYAAGAPRRSKESPMPAGPGTALTPSPPPPPRRSADGHAQAEDVPLRQQPGLAHQEVCLPDPDGAGGRPRPERGGAAAGRAETPYLRHHQRPRGHRPHREALEE